MGLFSKIFGSKAIEPKAKKTEIKQDTIEVSRPSIEDTQKQEVTLDYDTHLKPATVIKKEQGEDKAIDYLFTLYESEKWPIDDIFSILSKAKGYIKKANKSNKMKIIAEYEKLLQIQGHYGGAQNLSKIYLNEKKYEKAFQYVSLAGSSINPNWDNHSLLMSQNSSQAANIIFSKGVTNVKSAIDHLYYSLHSIFFNIAWKLICDNTWNAGLIKSEDSLGKSGIVLEFRDSLLEFKENVNLAYPFDSKEVMKSLLIINPNIDIDKNTQRVQELIFVQFPIKFKQVNYQSDAAIEIIDIMINDYLDSI